MHLTKLHLTYPQICEFLLMLVVFLLPWQPRWIVQQGTLANAPWEYSTISIYMLDVVLLIFLCGAAVNFFENKCYRRLTHSQIASLLLIVISFLSIYFAARSGLAAYWWIKLVEGIALFIFTPFLQIRWRRVSAVLVIAAVIQSGYAYYQFITQEIVGNKWLGIANQQPLALGVQVIDTAANRVLRAYGSFPHPNILAGFLLVALVFCLYLYLHQKKILRSLPTAVALAVISLGLWLTFSRQAWLALALVLAVTIFSTFWRTTIFPARLLAATLIILVPFIIFSLSFPQIIQTRVHSTARLETRSLQERTQSWRTGLEVIKNNFLVGVGIGNYTGYVYDQDQTSDDAATTNGYDYQPAHNIYIVIWSELGIFGLLTFLFFITQFWLERQEQNLAPRRLAHDCPLPFAGVLALGGLLIIGLFDHYLWTLPSGIILFWLTSALTKSDL